MSSAPASSVETRRAGVRGDGVGARDGAGWAQPGAGLGLGSDFWKGLALAAAGLALVFTAPLHRVDLLAIGLLLAAGGIMWQPRVGVVLIGASLPAFFFGRSIAGPLAVTPPGLALVLTWLGVLAQAAWGEWVVRRHRSASSAPTVRRLRWPRSAYDAPLALFLLAALLSLLVTNYPLLSARELRALILEPVLFFWLLCAMPGSGRLALVGFLGAATLTAGAAIGQVAFGWGGTPAEGVLRAQAWYPSPNHLALMLGRAWPFLLAAALGGWRAVWLPLGVVGVAVVLTFSTGGWLGTAAATVVVVAALGRRRLALRAGGVAAVVLVVVSVLAIGGVLPERLNPLRQTGGFRLDLWLSSLAMIRDHPLLGVGLDNFVYIYQQDYLREGAAAEPNLSHPHNWLLHFWLELGILGLAAFVWLGARFWRVARASLDASACANWPGAGAPGTVATPWLVAGALGAMADLLVHGFIDNSYFLVDLAFVFWLCLALAAEALIRIDPT